MKIENCPYSQYCGDKTIKDEKVIQVWYCPWSGNKDLCRYDKCEKPTPKGQTNPGA